MWAQFNEDWKRIQELARLEKQLKEANLTGEELICLFADLAEESGLQVIEKKNECKVMVKKK